MRRRRGWAEMEGQGGKLLRRGAHVALAAGVFAAGVLAGRQGTATGALAVTSGSGTIGVTGVGGIFFKTSDADALRRWYRTHLGIEAEEWGGHAFHWEETGRPGETGYTVWGPFPESTAYFSPSEHPFMVNYRVADLTALVEALQREGVDIVGEVESHPNGKFAWILDLEGRKVELWEPVPASEDPYLQ